MTTTTPPGASRAAWAHYTKSFQNDLLPVVSNLGATISPTSKMKNIGKTPSRYNRARNVVGLTEWTSRQTTPADIAEWSTEPDYGICLQTRRVRAIDIDVEDAAKAAAIERAVRDWLALTSGAEPAVRVRANSGKRLIPIHAPSGEPYTKRRVVVDGGVIELLADGQQFIAEGTHPSGARYEWEGEVQDGLPEFPNLTVNELDDLWAALVAEFGIEPEERESATVGRVVREAGQGGDDPVVEFLENGLWVRSWSHDGRVNITCPWQHEHTGDSGDTETQYFPAGVGGFQQGHFKCLHAHCMGRTDVDYLDAIGYRAAQFQALARSGDGDGTEGADAWLERATAGGACYTDVRGKAWDLSDEAAWPSFERDKKGNILAALNNVMLGAASIPFVGCEIAIDDFKDAICIRGAGEQGVAAWGDSWRLFTDADYTRLRMVMTKRGFDEFSKETIKEVVYAVAVENHFDSAIAWLETLTWDGKPRVAGFAQTYMAVKKALYPAGYVEAVSEYLWSALAGRIFNPGCQADMVPVFISDQGYRKSTLCQTIPPDSELYVEINLKERDDNLSRAMRGKVVGEIGELRGLHTADSESIKQWMTRRHEEWIPKYKEFATRFPRRLVFIGTTNNEEFLADPTGERRWLPLRVGLCDIDRLRADREQLWAEGAHLWREGGVRWKRAEELARLVHGEHKIEDPWLADIEAWLADIEAWRDGDAPVDVSAELVFNRLAKGFSVRDVLAGALGFRPGQAKRTDMLRVTGILRGLGYEREHTKRGNLWRKC